MATEKQELWCHDCEHYVQFELNMSLNGNHVLECPNCGHEHCRVVKDGQITDIRWDSRNGQTWRVSPRYLTVSQSSTWDTSTSGSSILYAAWSNTTVNA